MTDKRPHAKYHEKPMNEFEIDQFEAWAKEQQRKRNFVGRKMWGFMNRLAIRNMRRGQCFECAVENASAQGWMTYGFAFGFVAFPVVMMLSWRIRALTFSSSPMSFTASSNTSGVTNRPNCAIDTNESASRPVQFVHIESVLISGLSNIALDSGATNAS